MFTDKTVAEIVAEDYRTAAIFRRYGIDFCCGGKIKVDELCEKKNIDPVKLKNDLAQSLTQYGNPLPENVGTWSLTFLADYIENVHHSYVQENLPLILQYAEKVAKVHGHANPEVITVFEYLEEANLELVPHMMKEEKVLFPLIRTLERAINGGQMPEMPVQNPISMMEIEHEMVGGLFKAMREITFGFNLPDHACNTWRVLYAKLIEFEEDLFRHIHLENNILFPKAISLQNQILSN